MKKQLFCLLTLFAIGLCTLMAAPVNPAAVCTLEPEAVSLKAGEPYQGTLTIKCTPGYVARNWDLEVIRKNTPPEFFNKKVPADKIKPYKGAPGYDRTNLIALTYLPQNTTEAVVKIKMDTTGFAPGDYAILAAVDFVEAKTITKYLTLYLNISEGDDKMANTFQENEPPLRSMKLEQPAMSGAVNGTIFPKMIYDMMPRVTLVKYDVIAAKKDLPAGFTGTPVENTPDMVYLVKNGSVGHARQDQGTISLRLPLTGLPVGKYPLIVRPCATKSGGSFRGVYTTDLPLVVEVK